MPFVNAVVAAAGGGRVTPMEPITVHNNRKGIVIDIDDDDDERLHAFDDEWPLSFDEPIDIDRRNVGDHLPEGFHELSPQELVDVAAALQESHRKEMGALQTELEMQKLAMKALEERMNNHIGRVRKAYGEEKQRADTLQREVDRLQREVDRLRRQSRPAEQHVQEVSVFVFVFVSPYSSSHMPHLSTRSCQEQAQPVFQLNTSTCHQQLSDLSSWCSTFARSRTQPAPWPLLPALHRSLQWISSSQSPKASSDRLQARE